ncbi:MAG: Na/Pi symporter, partial [Pseudomonadota bacterium]
MAGVASSWLIGDQSASMSGFNFLGAITKPVANGIVDLAGVFPATVGGLLVIALGIAMIMTSVIYLGKVLRGVMTGRARLLMQKALGRRPETGVLSGAVVTVLVQSSSTTTSLIVPLAGSGIVTLKQVFPFTMGANIGTCITALLAATAIVGENEVFALQIALVHLMYNVLGVLFFLYVPWLKSLPIRAATWLGERAGQHKGWAFGYIFALFFVMPGSVFAGDVLFDDGTSPGRELDLEQLEQCQIEVEACGMSVE